MDPQSLSTAFAIWAGVVGLIGVAIVWELSKLRSEIKAMGAILSQHQLETQGRLTAVETHLHFRDGYVTNHYRAHD